MEFQNLNVHCFYCNQLDYLPFKCDNCGKMFCLEHKDCKEHECQAHECQAICKEKIIPKNNQKSKNNKNNKTKTTNNR